MDFVTITTVVNMDDEYKRRIPKEKQEMIVNRDLFRKSAELIMENKDHFPVEFTEAHHEETRETEYRLRVNIISSFEYGRLKRIEEWYNNQTLFGQMAD